MEADSTNRDPVSLRLGKDVGMVLGANVVRGTSASSSSPSPSGSGAGFATDLPARGDRRRKDSEPCRMRVRILVAGPVLLLLVRPEAGVSGSVVFTVSLVFPLGFKIERRGVSEFSHIEGMDGMLKGGEVSDVRITRLRHQ
jgi:hypothetical protein